MNIALESCVERGGERGRERERGGRVGTRWMLRYTVVLREGRGTCGGVEVYVNLVERDSSN